MRISCNSNECCIHNICIKLLKHVLHICQGGLILKTSFKFIATLACLLALTGNIQAQEGNGGGGMVAVLDVAKVFKDNTVFTDRMNAIKKEAEDFKARMQQEESALRQSAERLNELAPGSPDHKSLEAELEKKSAELRVLASQTNTDLLNREAAIYYDTYIQMQNAVADLSTQYNITLVLRFDSGPIDQADRPDVIKGVNRNIVFQKNLDLTGMVVEKMGVSSAGVGQNIK